MHPPLDEHLHSSECNKIIRELELCHKDNPWMQYLGVCNDIKNQLNQCLREEFLVVRDRNAAKGRRKRERYEKLKAEIAAAEAAEAAAEENK
eukprot:Clim_evm30s153 gene=Clim_evmTU30s153